MTRDVYDDEQFFAAYSGLRRSVEGLDGAPEWPSLRAMVGEVAGLRVVDLGCGFGWFCRWAAGQGAADVVGIDRSPRMLQRAGAEPHPVVTYRQADLDRIELEPDRFDVVYSSLTLHYVDDLTRLVDQAHRCLAAGGRLVISVEHPIHTAPTHPGFVTAAHGSLTWPVDGYLREGTRTTDWLAPGVVKHHRTITTYVTTLLAAGFELTALVEWGPSAAQVAAVPEWAVELERPAFLLMAAERRPRPDGPVVRPQRSRVNR